MSLLTLGFNQTSQRIDLHNTPSAFLNWLENAVVISLFTDARCEQDELPQGETDQRGYWGDMDLPESESLGSKLWTLKREKITQDVINRAQDYAKEALEWLVDDHLQAVTINAERSGLDRIALQINCQLSDGSWIELYRDYLIGDAR